MKNFGRLALLMILVLALAATYRKLKEEGRADAPAREKSEEERLSDRIRSLPESPLSWQLLESAPKELDDPDIPDIGPFLRDLIASASSRIVLESYTMHRSWGAPAEELLKKLKSGVHVLAVVHPNLMNDMDFLDDLRSAGARLEARDLAPLGGNPKEGYVHAKFVVADGRRGYLGSANLNDGGMSENREIGIGFEDPALAQTLEMMASLDAGNVSSTVAMDLPSAVLLQGASEGFTVRGLPLCEAGVAALCGMAKTQIDIMMFAFTHQFGKYDAIANPLRAAVRRGVKVRLIHDARTMEDLVAVRPTLRDIREWGVDVRVANVSKLGAKPYGQYHVKSMCVDGEFLMVGSNNWTEAASHENRETALILRSTRMARQFLSRFTADWHSGHASPFIR